MIRGVHFDETGMVLLSELIRKELGEMDMSVFMGANRANEVAAGQFSESTIGHRRTRVIPAFQVAMPKTYQASKRTAPSRRRSRKPALTKRSLGPKPYSGSGNASKVTQTRGRRICRGDDKIVSDSAVAISLGILRSAERLELNDQQEQLAQLVSSVRDHHCIPPFLGLLSPFLLRYRGTLARVRILRCEQH